MRSFTSANINWTTLLLALMTFLSVGQGQQKGETMKEQFLTAVTQGDTAKIKEMLKTDPTLARATDQNGVSAITKAAYYRKMEVVQELLNAGVELNIFEAAATGQTQRVKELLKKDPQLANSFSSDGFTPLGLAVFFGNKDSVKALLAGGAQVNLASRESMKVTPLHSAAAAKEVEIARLLIASGADVNARQAEMGFTPLHEAASNGNIELATLLIEKGADINATTNDGKTPLAFAIERKQETMVEFLRKHGAKN
jgi:ankyrin repeat protein